ncbi:MAG: MFS transporter [Alphaproteobacteria bacterium]|nr:MFS transporter [Alphaproteobacteria bacterium]MCW5738773.1 MFS transporter [Alphaproteobacteria bacterium]
MSPASGIESGYAWRLALVSMICIAASGGSAFLPIVAMSQMAQEFGGQRQVPSLAYTLGYIGAGAGGIMMGWLADRFGPRPPLLLAAGCVALGAWLGAQGGQVTLLASYGLLLGFLGNAATFTPMLNNIQGWFDARRGIAVAIVSVGPAVGGFVWPQIYRALLPDFGWRDTLVIFGLIAAVVMILGALYVRPAPMLRGPGNVAVRENLAALPLPSPTLMALLSAASFCCCLAMAMPFAHMVAFCGDLGFAAERGAEAVSLVLLSAIASTFVMGRLADKIGPLPTSLICSAIQIVALVGFLFVASLWGIYTLSAIHGIPFIAIVQGYALNLRALYGPGIGGWRLGVVLFLALSGMAVGGWLGGVIFDATGSYTWAFRLALLANLVNLALLTILFLAQRGRPRSAMTGSGPAPAPDRA